MERQTKGAFFLVCPVLSIGCLSWRGTPCKWLLARITPPSSTVWPKRSPRGPRRRRSREHGVATWDTNGNQRKPMKTKGNQGKPTETYGNLWKLMKTNGNKWKTTETNGNLWKPMETNGKQWNHRSELCVETSTLGR